MTQNGTSEPDELATLTHYGPQFPSDTASRVVSVDENGLREILLKLRSGEKFIADLAAKLDVSPQMLGDVLAGRSGFGPKLLKGLGVVRTYQMYDVGPKWVIFDEE